MLAKYGKTKSFFWAKVSRVYQTSSGACCDVSWLRPQAGSAASNNYALVHDVDETLHGEGLAVTNLRRPSSFEVADGAPPGAARSMASVGGYMHADLLGDAVVQKASEPFQEGTVSSLLSLDLLGVTGFSQPVALGIPQPVPLAHSMRSSQTKASGSPFPTSASTGVPYTPSAPSGYSPPFAQSFAPKPINLFQSCSIGPPCPNSSGSPQHHKQQAPASAPLNLGSNTMLDLCSMPSRSAFNPSPFAKPSDASRKKDERFDFVSDMMTSSLRA